MTLEAIEEFINERVAEALAAYEANRAAELVFESQSHNRDDDENRNVREMESEMAGEMETEMETEIKDAMGMEILIEIIEMVHEEEDWVEKFIGGLPDNVQGNVIAAEPTRLQDVVCIANNLMDQNLKGYTVKNAKNKRRDCMNVVAATATQRTPVVNQRVLTYFECGRQGHYRNECPKLKNQTHGNKAGKKTDEARGTTCADRSFVSSTFSALLNVITSMLDVSYVVKLAYGRITKTNTVLRGCTLGLLGHPFNIDLMPVELGSFNVIIGMD
uniref:CCHC-type domain-containing protein n=1 Tax=Tanacetum cinerariifolium TaxID=118510 RepID=A0A6L2J4T4_TANCI|nr:hypothetical protein [Tanacetum cinerariifolium]